ncbi:MAG TPA: STAS domain-containing protein [Anaerolineales bacterium]|nr:STAS domain-containing protein [Anaerolineales bacterium]
MQIKSELISPHQAVLYPTGRMDVESSAAVRQAILDLVDSGVRYLVVDLVQVEFMDSSGLSALVSGMKALRRSSGMLTICQANAQIRTALRLTMLDRVFPIYEDIPAALEAAETDQPPAL